VLEPARLRVDLPDIGQEQRRQELPIRHPAAEPGHENLDILLALGFLDQAHQGLDVQKNSGGKPNWF
jgi:hypothetical protein